MRSSTSNSDRFIPEQRWQSAAIVMALTVVAFFALWEVFWRARGYSASYNDTPELWAISRDKIRRDNGNSIVLLGDSRIRFDLNPDIVSEAFDGRPVHSLAMNGSVARPVLHEIAEDENFTGIVLCSYTPNLFWMPGGPLLGATHDWIEMEKGETIADRSGQYIAMAPQRALAFINQEDLALKQLLASIPISNREGYQGPPAYPPYMCYVGADRRELMWERVESDQALQQKIQNTWSGLFSFMKPLPPKLLAKLRAEVAADVKKIESRGGKVIFLRLPSTEDYRETENRTAPRQEYWEPLLKETGAPGVHFEDYEELSHYDCPEWSHLSARDKSPFTRALMQIVVAKLS